MSENLCHYLVSQDGVRKSDRGRARFSAGYNEKTHDRHWPFMSLEVVTLSVGSHCKLSRSIRVPGE